MTWTAHVVTVPPSAVPMVAADVRDHVRADDAGDDDALLGLYVSAAIGMVQSRTGTKLITQTVAFSRRRLEHSMRVPIGPVQSLSLSYLDAAGVSQTLDPSCYAVTGIGTLAPRIEMLPGQAWPSLLAHPAALTCHAVVGYGDSADGVPDVLLQATRMLVADWFGQREDTIAERSVTPATMPNGVKALLANYEVY